MRGTSWENTAYVITICGVKKDKGPYPLGDLGKIGTIIGAIIGGRRPFIAPATHWVWPKIAGSSLGHHRGQGTGDCRPISRMFDISLQTDRRATASARRAVAQQQRNQVGMALYDSIAIREPCKYHWEWVLS